MKDDHGIDAMRYAFFAPKRKPRRRVCWLLVDRHGYPDGVYGNHDGKSGEHRARESARKMNACGPSSDHAQFGPWRAVPAIYNPKGDIRK